jgi:hypothetical protein
MTAFFLNNELEAMRNFCGEFHDGCHLLGGHPILYVQYSTYISGPSLTASDLPHTPHDEKWMVPTLRTYKKERKTREKI